MIATNVPGWPEQIKRKCVYNLGDPFWHFLISWTNIIKISWTFMKKSYDNIVYFFNGDTLPVQMSIKWFNCFGE